MLTPPEFCAFCASRARGQFPRDKSSRLANDGVDMANHAATRNRDYRSQTGRRPWSTLLEACAPILGYEPSPEASALPRRPEAAAGGSRLTKPLRTGFVCRTTAGLTWLDGAEFGRRVGIIVAPGRGD
jgi:hypothetical protein